MSKQYMVVCQQIYTNYVPGENNEWSTGYNCDFERFNTLKQAIRHGWKVRDSDDFNIVIVDGNKLIDWCYMEKSMEEEPEVLEEIAGQLSLEYSS